MRYLLKLINVAAEAEGKTILTDCSLALGKGEVHAVMGPNGSGKSTLAHVIMGDPRYNVTRGQIFFNGTSLKGIPTYERARMGMFLAFQHPPALPGVAVRSYLSRLYALKQGKREEFAKALQTFLPQLNLHEKVLERSLNDGFSGGEKKKLEVLQILLFKPSFIILDEVDSGLDVDALKAIGKALVTEKPKESALLVITHYERILEYVTPDAVHILDKGKITQSGGVELVRAVESVGYRGGGV